MKKHVFFKPQVPVKPSSPKKEANRSFREENRPLENGVGGMVKIFDDIEEEVIEMEVKPKQTPNKRKGEFTVVT